jgi:hypothetical protein
VLFVNKEVKMKKCLLGMISLLLISSPFAGEKEGITIPDKMTLAGKELVLNGMGVRRATFFNIKVYVGGLYVSQKSTDAKAILEQPLPKYITMNFLRDVDSDSLTDAWKEGFVAAVPEAKRKALMPALEEFNKAMGNIKKEQTILVSFLETGVEVVFNGKKSGPIGNAEFSKALFSIWFVNARDEELRDELLGKI